MEVNDLDVEEDLSTMATIFWATGVWMNRWSDRSLTCRRGRQVRGNCRSRHVRDPRSWQTVAKISLFLSLSRHNFLSFFPLLGVLSLIFGGVFGGPSASNTTKIPRKDPKRGRKKENWRGKKSAKFWAVPSYVAPPFGAHLSLLHPSGPRFFKVWACTL